MLWRIFFAISFYLLGTTKAQTTSGVLNGQYYLCLPTGTACPTSGSGTIDPRIVTPTGTVAATCPAGTTPCFGTNTACGTRFITPNMTGNGAASYGAYPWQAYLRNTTNAFAGSGVLVSPYYVITAAHKVYLNVNTPTAVTVLMGVYNPSSLVNVQSSTVTRIAVHPQFVAATLINDIAVLQLTQPIVLGIYANINTACLPAAGTSYIGQSCVVSGWGQTAFTTFDAPTNPQKQAFVTITTYATCRASYAAANLLGTNVDTYLDQNGEICAGGVSMLDACTQDGGSPLVCPSTTGVYSIAGLVIWGKNCGQAGVYGVYVNVPVYATWIQGQMTTTAG
ncbi:inactive CLIP domain-containing serine protease A3-like [Diabrotica undecimpunctata]|uniref:inactive CLIP domain-containing serine protease A3-like n=1 Tax=Diabrotica undecimpunctata TaxID=50387 RepID=UPI003B63F86D